MAGHCMVVTLPPASISASMLSRKGYRLYYAEENYNKAIIVILDYVKWVPYQGNVFQFCCQTGHLVLLKTINVRTIWGVYCSSEALDVGRMDCIT